MLEIKWSMRNWLTYFQSSSVQSLSRVQLFATPWIAARQASLSITNSQSSLRLTSIESVMPSSHLILCCPLLLLPPIPPSIRVFSNESTLHMRWPKYWRFSFSISPSNEHPGLISFRMDWLDLLAVQGTHWSRVQLFVTPWITELQASLSITNSWSLLKLISIESVMPSSHLILCHPLLLLPPIPPRIRVFSNESTLLHEVAKVLEFQLQYHPFQWTPRTDLL